LANHQVGDPVSSIAVSPDGKVLAVGREWGTIQILDSSSLEHLRTLQEVGQTVRVAFSPDGTLLAATGDTGTITLWETATWTARSRWSHPREIRELSYSPTGETLATFAINGVARIWSAATGEIVQEYGGFARYGAGLAFSPDGRRFAVGDRDGRIQTFDVVSGLATLEIEAVENGVSALTYSPDGSILAAGGWETGLITLWNSVTGELMGELSGHGARCSSVVFGADAGILVSASTDQTVRLWDVAARETRAILKGSQSGITQLRALTDGRRFVSGAGDGTVALWGGSPRISEGQPTLLPELANSVRLSGGEPALLAVNRARSVVLADSRRPGDVAVIHSLGTNNTAATWSTDKALLAVADNRLRRVKVWSQDKDELITLLHTMARPVQALMFLDHGAYVLAFTYLYEVAAWNTETWQPAEQKLQVWEKIMEPLNGSRGWHGNIESLMPSPDGGRLVLGTDRGFVLWFDLQTGRRLAEVRCHQRYVNTLAFSEDGRMAASCGSDGKIVLWATGSPAIVDTIRTDARSA
jgi:WD40 repeat protein